MKLNITTYKTINDDMAKFFEWSESFGTFLPFNENTPISLTEAYIEYSLQQEDKERGRTDDLNNT